MSDIITKLAGIKGALKGAALTGGAVSAGMGLGHLANKKQGRDNYSPKVKGALGGYAAGMTLAGAIGGHRAEKKAKAAKAAKMEKKATITLAWLEKSAKKADDSGKIYSYQDDKGKRYTQTNAGQQAEDNRDMSKAMAKHFSDKAKKVGKQSGLRNRLTTGAKGALAGGILGATGVMQNARSSVKSVAKGALAGAAAGGGLGAAIGSTRQRKDRADGVSASYSHDAKNENRTANKSKNKRQYY